MPRDNSTPTREEMLAFLERAFPNAVFATTYARYQPTDPDQDGYVTGAIWMTGGCDDVGLPLYEPDPYSSINPKLDKLLSHHGWVAFPYDNVALVIHEYVGDGEYLRNDS